MWVWTILTKLGWVAAARSDGGLVALTLPRLTEIESLAKLADLQKLGDYELKPPGRGDALGGLSEALNRYFEGDREEFNFTVDMSLYTLFQQRVLQVVRQIPYGSLLSYKQVATICGSPGAARAVGGAVGSNRHLLVIPCHRVVRSDGTLGGFGNGLDWKTKLLALEKVYPESRGEYPIYMDQKTGA